MSVRRRLRRKCHPWFNENLLARIWRTPEWDEADGKIHLPQRLFLMF